MFLIRKSEIYVLITFDEQFVNQRLHFILPLTVNELCQLIQRLSDVSG